jgi:hypothetical protein
MSESPRRLTPKDIIFDAVSKRINLKTGVNSALKDTGFSVNDEGELVAEYGRVAVN